MNTPCPGTTGCRCPYCYGLREHMLATTGADYGLPVTFKPWRALPGPESAPIARTPTRVRQPWEPRPARKVA